MKLPWVKRSALIEQAELSQHLSDRLRTLEAERDSAREAAAASALEARDALRLVADWLAEHQFGKQIFNTAPKLPSETPLVDRLGEFNLGQRKTRARDLVKLGEERFLQSFRDVAANRSTPDTSPV